jgi:serine/threonine protein kinase
MHEMISGRHPFHGTTHYDTLRNMVTKPPTIDPRLSPQAAAIVKSLLIKNPRTRLGGKEGISEMKQVPYFAMVNWEELHEKKIEMPYKPKLTGEMDISSFETTFTKEKPIDSIPEPDKRNENDKKKAANKGLLGMFGLGGNNTNGGNAGGNKAGDEKPDPDAFKGFSFTKEGDSSLYSTTNQK